MRMTQKLRFKCPLTKKDLWYESSTMHDLLTFLALKYFETEYEAWDRELTGWVLCSDGNLILLCGDMQIASIQDASWEE